MQGPLFYAGEAPGGMGGNFGAILSLSDDN